MRPSGDTLSDRDAACLRAIASLPARAARAERLRASGLSWDQWRRAVESLCLAGRVARVEGNRAEGEPDSLTLTESGKGVWRTCGDRHTPPQVIATRPDSSLSLKSLDSEEKKEEREEARPPQGGVAPQVVVVRIVCPALDRIAAAMEGKAANVERCACGRVIVSLKGPFGDYKTCPAKKRCPYYEPKKQAPVEGPRVSSVRSERERAARVEAAAKAAAESKRVS